MSKKYYFPKTFLQELAQNVITKIVNIHGVKKSTVNLLQFKDLLRYKLETCFIHI